MQNATVLFAWADSFNVIHGLQVDLAMSGLGKDGSDSLCFAEFAKMVFKSKSFRFRLSEEEKQTALGMLTVQ